MEKTKEEKKNRNNDPRNCETQPLQGSVCSSLSLSLSLSAFSLTLKKTQASSFRSKPKKTSPPPVSTVVTIRCQSLHVKSKPKTREGPKFTPVAERKRGGRKRVSERHEKNPAVSTETQVFCGKRWAVRYLMAFV